MEKEKSRFSEWLVGFRNLVLCSENHPLEVLWIFKYRIHQTKQGRLCEPHEAECREGELRPWVQGATLPAFFFPFSFAAERKWGRERVFEKRKYVLKR